MQNLLFYDSAAASLQEENTMQQTATTTNSNNSYSSVSNSFSTELTTTAAATTTIMNNTNAVLLQSSNHTSTFLATPTASEPIASALLQVNNSWPLWDFTTKSTATATTAAAALLHEAGGGGVSSSITTDVSSILPAVFGEGNSFQQLLNITNNTYNDGFAVTETPFVPYVLRPETYIVPVLFAFIFIVGVLGNGTLIVVFLGVRQMRNVPNTYILSLALADLLVIVITVPLTSTVYTVDSWPWGSFLCTLSEFIKDVSIGVSVFTLTALSGDRYFAIVDPLRKFHAHGGGKRATRMTIATAVSIWLLAILCGLPALIATHVKVFEVNTNTSFSTCYPFPEAWGWEYAKAMVMLRFLVYYAIPLIIIGAFYILIARHLMYTASVPGEMQGAVRQVRARRKVAVTVLAFVVIFGICFLPYHVFMLWFYYWPTAQDDYNSFWHVLRILGFCLSFANSCANPVALYFVSGAFRKHFNRYLFCQGPNVRNIRHDTLCMHRDTSLTSTASKRYYSRRSCHHQSTMRSRLQETTITTMLPNGINGNGNINDDITSEYCPQQHHQHQHHQLL